MSTDQLVAVRQYDFSESLFDELQTNHYAKDLWPIVYILSDGKKYEAYVGETTDAYARMRTHLKHKTKKKLTSVHLISSERFNKSATLDIESNLIKYLSGDGQFKLLNGNLGLANHSYYQKREVYWNIFETVWDKLRAYGIAKHSISHINNSDLFKYSPYKTLTRDQILGLKEILHCILEDKYENVIIEGGAGTGKTILAVFLFKLLATDHQGLNFSEFREAQSEFLQLVGKIKSKYPKPKMGLVVPMSSFRSTLRKVFKNIKGLKSNMVIGPADVTKEKYDIVLVDESHRLRRRNSIGAYIGAFNNAAERLGLDPATSHELEWVVRQSSKTILFYDEGQSVKPSDVKQEHFEQLKQSATTAIRRLKSQFRVRGGNSYVDFIDGMLRGDLPESTAPFQSRDYEFVLFDSIADLRQEIRARDKETGLARMIAGYSWEWVSKKDDTGELKDIEIEGIQLRWNSTASDWINSENAVEEVGCIHTTQGYDLNYAGIIFGREITYDKEQDEIVILKDHYLDPTGRRADNPEQLKQYVINIYKTVMLRGIRGTYVYAYDDNLRDYLAKFIPPFASATKVRRLQPLPSEDVRPFKNAIPVYPLDVAAGDFGDVQQVEDVDWVSPPEGVKPSEDLFVCRVVGESMNRVIENGAHCLFRKYQGGSRNGEIVLVEHTDFEDADFGSCYTVKEYHSKKYQDENGWRHREITLRPLSFEERYEPIVLKDDALSSFRVIGVFERVI